MSRVVDPDSMTIAETVPPMSPTDEKNRPALTTRVVADEEAFLSLHDAWNELVVDSSATVYQTHEWLSLWWKHFGDPRRSRLAVVTVYSGSRLVGIAPLFSEELRVGSFVLQTTLRLLGAGSAFGRSMGLFLDNGPSDYLDVIIRKGFETEVSSVLYDAICELGKGADALEFVNVRETSRLAKGIVPLFQQGEYRCRMTPADRCPRMKSPASLDLLLEGLRSSVRRRLSQSLKAERGGMFGIRDLASGEALREVLPTLMTLHQRRWNRLGYPGLFADRRYREFIQDLLPALASGGMAWGKSAEADHQTMAVRIGFVLNGRFYDYLSGFDDASPAARRRPGMALLLRMIEEARSRGVDEIDFLRGDEQYKFELTTEAVQNWNIVVSRRASGGNAKAVVAGFVRGLGFLGFLLSRERTLIGVQVGEHGLLKSIPRYIAFRAGRFTRKLSGLFAGRGIAESGEEES